MFLTQACVAKPKPPPPPTATPTSQIYYGGGDGVALNCGGTWLYWAVDVRGCAALESLEFILGCGMDATLCWKRKGYTAPKLYS